MRTLPCLRTTIVRSVPLLGFLATLNATAQITLDGQSSIANAVITTLETNGIKFYKESPTGFILYNYDDTEFRNVTYPTLGPGFEYTSARFISESLFDTDPTTIEYLATYQDTAQIPTTSGVYIYREDGTVLLNVFPAGIGTGLEIMLTNQPIFTLGGSAYLAIRHVGSPGGDVYLLPGHIPCSPCGDLVQGTGGSHIAGGGSGILAFPNPAQDNATIRYELPAGATKGILLLFSSNGELVKRIPVNGSGSRAITTADMAAGTYLYQLETDQGVIGAKRLVIVR